MGRQVPRICRLFLVFVLVDLLAVAIGFGAGILIADGIRLVAGLDQVSATVFLADRGRELGLLAGLTIAIFAFGGLYRRSAWETDEIRRIVGGVALVALFDAALQFVLRDHNSRLWFVTAYPMVVLSVISLRMAVRGLPSVREAMTSNLILLGSGVAPGPLVYEMRESRAGPVKLLRNLPLSRVVNRDPRSIGELIERLARQADVPVHRITTVISPTPEEIDQAQDVINLLAAAGQPCSVILPFTGLARNGVSLQKVVGADMVMAEIQDTRPGVLPRMVKRLFDLVVSSMMLVLLSPVLLVLAGALALEKGPIFFSQLRVGRNGRIFQCLKFRSMRPDAEARLVEFLASDPEALTEWKETQKLRNDPRITLVGGFLRKTSLDELPQLLNVLAGDMSLVGPRPIVAPEVPGYSSDRAYFESADFTYYARCTPGITGLWQVSGRSDTRHEERVRLDRWYARNWSFWLDLMILLKTIRTVLGRSGSAL